MSAAQVKLDSVNVFDTHYEDENGAEWELSIVYDYTPSYGGDKGEFGEPLSPPESAEVEITEIYRKEPVNGLDDMRLVDFWDGIDDDEFERIKEKCLEHHESNDPAEDYYG